MIVNSFNPNYYSNYQTNFSKSKSVAFTGKIDDHVEKIKNGELPDVQELLADMKGNFNYKSKDVEAVVGVLVECAQNRGKEIANLEASLKQTQEDLDAEKQKVQKAYDESKANSDRCTGISRDCADKLAKKDEELAEMRALVEKYKPMCSVKSVYELDTVMPEEAVQVLNEMLENRSKAAESLVDFLFHGKGQEEFLAQMDRNSKILKANSEGVMDDLMVKRALEKIANRETYAGYHQARFVINLIGRALKTSEESANLSNKSVREQVKKNAMALLAPVADERKADAVLGELERELDEMLNSTVEYRNAFRAGKEKFIQEFARNNYEYTEVYVPGSENESGLKVTKHNGRDYNDFIAMWRIVNKGKSNY